MTASPSPCLCFFWLMPLFPSWLCRPTCCPSIYWDVRIDSHGLCVPSCWSCLSEAASTQLGGSAPHVSGAALSFSTPSHMRSVCGYIVLEYETVRVDSWLMFQSCGFVPHGSTWILCCFSFVSRWWLGFHTQDTLARCLLRKRANCFQQVRPCVPPKTIRHTKEI